MKKIFLSITLLLCCGTYVRGMEITETNKINLKKIFDDENILIVNCRIKRNPRSSRDFITTSNDKHPFDYCTYNTQSTTARNRVKSFDEEEFIKNSKYGNYKDILLLELHEHKNYFGGNTRLINSIVKCGVNSAEILQYALGNSPFNIIELLLESPYVDVNTSKDSNRTPSFFELIENGKLTTNQKIKIFEKCNANMFLLDRNNGTIMHCLCRFYNSFGNIRHYISYSMHEQDAKILETKLAKFFIKKGVDINKSDDSGNTVLHLLANWEEITSGIAFCTRRSNFFDPIKKMVSLLREKGAHYIKNNNGLTTFDVALNNKNQLPKFLDLFIPPEQDIKEFEKTFDNLISYYVNPLDKAFSTMQNDDSKKSRKELSDAVKACKQSLVKYLENKRDGLEKEKKLDKAIFVNTKLTGLTAKIHSVKTEQEKYLHE